MAGRAGEGSIGTGMQSGEEGVQEKQRFTPFHTPKNGATMGAHSGLHGAGIETGHGTREESQEGGKEEEEEIGKRQ